MTTPVSSCCSGNQSPLSTGPHKGDGFDAIPLSYWIRLAVSILLTTNSLVLALSFNVSELADAERLWLSATLLIVTCMVVGLLGWPLIKNFVASVQRLAISMESLFVVGILGAFAYSVVSMVRGEGAIYFEVVSVLVVIYSLGNLFKSKARRKATFALKQWSPEEMKCHLLLPGGRLNRVAVASIKQGDLVRVFPGQVIPVDGTILLGQALVKQANMTGEPFVISKSESDSVLAATHCVDGTITIRASAAGTERGIDGIVAAVETWSSRNSKSEAHALGLVRLFFKIVMVVALTTLLVCGLALSNWSAGFLNALAVLLVACPCAIGFATPIGIWSGLVRLANAGLYFNDGDAITKLSRTNHLVIDKTGTLTAFEPELVDFRVLDPSLGKDDLLRLVGAVEQVSDHPIARIFHDSNAGQLSADHFEVEEVTLLPGKGIHAEVCVNQTARMNPQPPGLQVLQATPSKPAVALMPAERTASSNSTWNSGQRIAVEIVAAPSQPNAMLHQVNISINERKVAIAEFSERALPQLAELEDGLAKLNVKLSLLSGDVQQRVDQLGFKHAYGGMTPLEKLGFVENLIGTESVLFVGDGVNDVAAMSAATMSIAVKSGSPMAIESADGVWNGMNPLDLLAALRIARLTADTIKTNMIFAAIYNSIGMTAAAIGWLHPVAAAVLMLASSLTVTIRSTRLIDSDHRFDGTHLGQP